MSDRTSVQTSPALSPDGEREFVDAEGSRWRVYEQPNPEYDRRRGSSLIFSSDAAVRRVRQYPANWRTLSNEELARLSWMA